MMLLACSVHTETMAASQKVNVGAADAQERAGVGRRGLDGDWPVSTDNLRAHGDVNDDTIQGANETIHGPGAGQEMQDEAEGSRGWSTGCATAGGVTGEEDRDGCGDAAQVGNSKPFGSAVQEEYTGLGGGDL